MFACIENWFKYHTPKGNQAERYTKIREAAKVFAYVIDESCPNSADKTVAMRKLREVVMMANVSIACNE